MDSYWGNVNLINAFWFLFNGQEADMSTIMKDTQIISCTQRREIQNITIFYHKLCKGGVERVVSMLVPIYIEMGYSVILITDEPSSDEDFEIPKGIRRYVIPPTYSVCRKDIEYYERGMELQRVLLDEKIDVLSYQAASSHLLFYDLLVAKLNDVEFIVTKHELFSQDMVRFLNKMTYENAVFPLVDKLVVLSSCKQLYWNTLGVRAYYVPNPCPQVALGEEKDDDKYVVWVGRLDRYQKRYQDIVPIFDIVAQEVPNVKVKIYGSAESYEDIFGLQKSIKDSGLEENIQYCGYVTDLNEIFKGAQIHLVTSVYESFPMGIFESHALGIPLVTYEMPYLEMLKEDGGTISVEPLNYSMTANAIIDLLQDRDKMDQMGIMAKRTAEQYGNDKVIEGWSKVLSDSVEYGKNSDQSSEYKIILETLAFHYSLGWKEMDAVRKMKGQLQKEKWVNEIKLKMLENHLDVVLYPYGDIGKRTQQLLNDNGIREHFIVDNRLADKNKGIYSIGDLEKVDCNKYLFVICSDKLSIYDEIRDALKQRVPEDNIYDLFPLE